MARTMPMDNFGIDGESPFSSSLGIKTVSNSPDWSELDQDRVITAASFPECEWDCALSRKTTIELAGWDKYQPDAEAQAWLKARFDGLTLADFRDFNIRIYCTEDLDAPEGFEKVWFPYLEETVVACQALMTEDVAESLDALLVISNTEIVEQQHLLSSFLDDAEDVQNLPPILCVLHGSQSGEVKISEEGSAAWIERGVNGMITGQPVGFNLVLEVQSWIRRMRHHSMVFNETINEKRFRGERAKRLRELNERILWDYARIKVAPSLPPVDRRIPRGDIEELDGLRFGSLLGQGAFGKVWRLEKRSADGPEEVVKSVAKAQFTEVEDVAYMARTLAVMQTLSSKENRHPNLTQFYGMYHSGTHFYFRFEDAGPKNLHQRLAQRRPGRNSKPLPARSALSIMTQIASALAHLHGDPLRVCHRDVKPENILVTEPPDAEPLVKLTDFDLAVAQAPGERCRRPCGTMPFTAPEVVLERRYCGFAADVWSMAVVMLELQCGLHVLGTAMSLPKVSTETTVQIAKMMREELAVEGAPARIVGRYGFSAMLPVAPCVERLAASVLKAEPSERWPAATVCDFLRASSLRSNRRAQPAEPEKA